MASPWINRVVVLRHWDGTGQMKVTQTDGPWAGCVPTDPDSIVGTIGRATADGVLWIRKQDLRECELQGETLL